MKMNKKGFTLIELLAVIVILAIIALIATPIVMNVINNAQAESNERSVEKYIAQLELGYTNAMLTSTDDDAAKTAAATFADANTKGKTVECTPTWGTGDQKGSVESASCTVDSAGYTYSKATGARKN